MARLNEASTAVDEVELIKRKVLRQNQELAKANSRLAQAVRSATADTTRVEAENLELRETIIHLEAQLSSTHRLPDSSRIEQIKSDLQNRLSEIGSLIATIGAGVDGNTKIELRRTSLFSDREPQLRLALPPYGLSPIGEDSTLHDSAPDLDVSVDRLCGDDTGLIEDVEELELSPPRYPTPLSPTKSFVVHSDEPKGHDTDEETEETDIPATLVNLEVRRKRKDISSRSGRGLSLPSFDSPDETIKLPKRKSMRDVDEPVSDFLASGFTFNKRASASRQDLTADCPENESQVEPPEETPPQTVTVERKVLGIKSVNMSPQKRVQSDKPKGKLDSENRDPEQTVPEVKKERKRQPRIPRTAHPRAIKKEVIEVIPISELGPTPDRCPPVVDILAAPELTEPPEVQIATKEGPPSPPPEEAIPVNHETIENSIQAQHEGSSSRPSRRARGAVSYAEPSLNSKLRRSTKGMVDAVYRPPSDRTSGEQEIKIEDTSSEGSTRPRRRSSLSRTSTGSRRSKSLHDAGPTTADDSGEAGVPKAKPGTTDEAEKIAQELATKLEEVVLQQQHQIGKAGRQPLAVRETIVVASDDQQAKASPSAREGRRSDSTCYSSALAEDEGGGIGAPAAVSSSRRRSTVM